MSKTSLKRRARRAKERQLDYQQRKADALKGREAEVIADMVAHSAAVRAKLERVAPISRQARGLEVGSGAHGLIFCFDAKERIGIDPLADHYRELFPAWQGRATTLAAEGEDIPFDDSSFDVVLCDNVVDHAESPRRIVEQIARVLKPGGLLYFTVNVHHPLYHRAARLHAGLQALRIPFEITPFADHTVHLTLDRARRLFAGLPLKIVRQSDTIEQTRREGPRQPARHLGDRLKRVFFKNAKWEAIAVRT